MQGRLTEDMRLFWIRQPFYPEGGSKPCDLGTLNGISVVDVQEKGSEIVHYTEKPLETGSKATGKIDW